MKRCVAYFRYMHQLSQPVNTVNISHVIKQQHVSCRSALPTRLPSRVHLSCSDRRRTTVSAAIRPCRRRAFSPQTPVLYFRRHDRTGWSRLTYVLVFLPANFQLAMPFRSPSRRSVRHGTDRRTKRTDGRLPSTLSASTVRGRQHNNLLN